MMAAFDDAGRPYRLGYHLGWDERWRVRETRLIVTTEKRARRLALAGDGRGNWRDGQGRALPRLRGGIDVDIWPTPFTNTLAIRRLALAVKERREVGVVYIVAPALTACLVRQAYTRLANRRYLFESLGGRFSAELSVDVDGLVLDYPGLFRRLH